MAQKRFHLHLVSDATGETISRVARATVSLFDDVEPVEHLWTLVRTVRQLDVVIGGIKEHPGVVLFTLVDLAQRGRLEDACRALKLPCVSVLDPAIEAFTGFLRIETRRQPGRQHVLDEEYFRRMDAMDFALMHDDGMGLDDIHEADVVLVGVSRTSKTPTCVYLANRGVKAANVPLIAGRPPPAELDALRKVLVVGLTNDPDRLVSVRRSRVRLWRHGRDSDYVDPDQVRQEVTAARRLFARKGWPTIDVSRRSIEETAAEILTLLAERQSSED